MSSRSPLVTNTIDFKRILVAVPGTPEQLSEFQIPDGFKTVFTTRVANDGDMYLANTSADASSSTGDRKILIPGQSVTLEIDNLNLLWVDADNSTDVMEVTYLAPA